MLQQLGIAIASLCLVATLAMAGGQKGYSGQSQGTELTCTQEDVKGTCTAVAKPDGTTVAVQVANAQIGDKVMCTEANQGMQCTRATKK